MGSLQGVRIGCAMTGSFCTFEKAFQAWRDLRSEGAELIPIMSHNAYSTDTRFFSSLDARNTFSDICGRDILRNITDVEPIGPKRLIDLLIIAPCTGNTLAKLANGIADTSVTLSAKSHLRNGLPLLIAVSTNDGLSGNAGSIARLLNTKHVFFDPFSQDAPHEKPFSLIANFQYIVEASQMAIDNMQMQPIICRD